MRLLLGSVLGLVAPLVTASNAFAEITAAAPVAPITPPYPADGGAIEVQVALQLVVDAEGRVESAVVVGRAPASAAPSFEAAAVAAAKVARFEPSTRDGRPIRSRVEYVVVFQPPLAAPAAPTSTAATRQASAPSAAPDYIEVRGTGWASPRGIGDVRIQRELLAASPRQQTSELLSAAPGFFVDHEEGEGFGNDVYLRGFDLEHGSGIEMRVGGVPINSPVHVQGQGYADANFIIPEVVRSIRVLEGPYDPRQGDAAIVGSAYFELAAPERGNLVKGSFGSWNQMRLVAVTAPRGADEETFAAFSARKTDGFGVRRAAEAGSLNAQYGLDLDERDHLRLLATAHTSRESLPGVVRQDDVKHGLIGAYDSYPYFTNGQGIQASRVSISATLDRAEAHGARVEVAPWLMWTDFRARQNLTGNIYSSALDPELAGGQGDLWETANRELAFGLASRFRAAPRQLTSWLEATPEPGLYIRSGHTQQSKSLLNPDSLAVWDRRLDANLDTLDLGAYLDLDLRLFRRLRLSGGVRGDFLAVTVDNRLGYDVPPRARDGRIPGSSRATQGLAASPRVTLAYDLSPELAVAASYGEGFRSLAANATVASSDGIAGEGPNIKEGGKPYSKVRSFEAGLRARAQRDRFGSSISLFETRVENELVFEASSGGFSTEGASVRRGVVASALAKPFPWLLASSALSVSSSRFTTLVPGVSHHVPNVPPVLFRADVTARAPIARIREAPLTARASVGYTFLAGRHLTDKIIGPSNHVLNAGAALRYRSLELGLDAYNVLNLQYADDAEYYVSNWSTQRGTPLATPAIHWSEAPPLTLLGSLSVYF